MTTDLEADMTAAELALGVLAGEERATALRRMLAEPDFAREVERWRSHFSIMFAAIQSVEPPVGLLARIETKLNPKKTKRFFWPAIATALAASLILVLLMRPAPVVVLPQSAPTLIATLIPATTGSSIPAVYDRVRGEIRVTSAGPTAPGRSAELWVIGGDGVPHSLGLLAANARSVVAIAPNNRHAMVAGNKLAISLEPAGGSPTGKPTGPIVAEGTFISL